MIWVRSCINARSGGRAPCAKCAVRVDHAPSRVFAGHEQRAGRAKPQRPRATATVGGASYGALGDRVPPSRGRLLRHRHHAWLCRGPLYRHRASMAVPRHNVLGRAKTPRRRSRAARLQCHRSSLLRRARTQSRRRLRVQEIQRTSLDIYGYLAISIDIYIYRYS
jgi:hypothetical protein